ncbi:MAG: hypothetical protein U5K79_02300 [Cyclobacteriaceae bacterium]|nr:hypothetical protein [Cyclobacteriaceae bacterium]
MEWSTFIKWNGIIYASWYGANLLIDYLRFRDKSTEKPSDVQTWSLALDEKPQSVNSEYGREAADTICAVAANVISGSARNKETLDWLEKLFGRVRQVRSGLSIDRSRTTVSMNEYMDNLIPASKIAGLQAGEIVAQLGKEATSQGNHSSSIYHCRIALDPVRQNKEAGKYKDVPEFYNFGTDAEREQTLRNNFTKINREVATIAATFE